MPVAVEQSPIETGCLGKWLAWNPKLLGIVFDMEGALPVTPSLAFVVQPRGNAHGADVLSRQRKAFADGVRAYRRPGLVFGE